MPALAKIEPSAPRRGTHVGRYRVLRPIASGGMADVVLAVDPALQRRVALKLPKPGSSHELVREAKALAQINHPHVLGVYEVESGASGCRPFVALQFIAGQTLRQWCDAKPRPLDDVLEMYRRAGLGLAAVHRVGLVHRDFKPDNVLIGDDGQVRLGDFGLAGVAPPPITEKSVAEDSAPTLEADPATDPSWIESIVTQTFSEGAGSGRALAGGTPAYMAPEQRARGEVDARADQYSFCIALHEAVYGERPPSCRMPSLPTLTRPRARTVDPAPRALLDILRRGLAERRDRRWPTMEALLATLAALRLRRVGRAESLRRPGDRLP